jgi:hypothetical protein
MTRPSLGHTPPESLRPARASHNVPCLRRTRAFGAHHGVDRPHPCIGPILTARLVLRVHTYMRETPMPFVRPAAPSLPPINSPPRSSALAAVAHWCQLTSPSITSSSTLPWRSSPSRRRRPILAGVVTRRAARLRIYPSRCFPPRVGVKVHP